MKDTKRRIKVEKYQGSGNDFLLVSYRKGIDYSLLAKRLCSRRTSIGADGLICVKKKTLEMKIYNQDGTLAPMCGNGIRCFSLYAYNHQFIKKKSFNVKTSIGTYKVTIMSICPPSILVNMGKAYFDNELVKVNKKINLYGYPLVIEGKEYILYTLFIGTIHTVIFVDNVIEVYESSLGEKICNHPLFKEKTNVNFVKVKDKNNIIVRTFERGVGRTLSCGSGCCASFFVAHKQGYVQEQGFAHVGEDKLKIMIKDEVLLSGPAYKIFETYIEEK
ncbi:MAG: diaminopimelate epimerase [Bacilli bacterium]